MVSTIRSTGEERKKGGGGGGGKLCVAGYVNDQCMMQTKYQLCLLQPVLSQVM